MVDRTRRRIVQDGPLLGLAARRGLARDRLWPHSLMIFTILDFSLVPLLCARRPQHDQLPTLLAKTRPPCHAKKKLLFASLVHPLPRGLKALLLFRQVGNELMSMSCPRSLSMLTRTVQLPFLAIYPVQETDIASLMTRSASLPLLSCILFFFRIFSFFGDAGNRLLAGFLDFDFFCL